MKRMFAWLILVFLAIAATHEGVAARRQGECDPFMDREGRGRMRCITAPQTSSEK